jgi:hypothetical protein
VRRSVAELREAGVNVLLGDGHGLEFMAHATRRGDLDTDPWETALDALPSAS